MTEHCKGCGSPLNQAGKCPICNKAPQKCRYCGSTELRISSDNTILCMR